MRIKLSQSDWEKIGMKMGWMKSAQWSGRSDEGPPDPEEGAKLDNEHVAVEIEDMEIEGFDNILFGGMYTITYDYEFPVHDEGDDNIEIKDIVVGDLHCTYVGEGSECPPESEMERAKAQARLVLLNPAHGYPHDEHIREDASSKDPRPRPYDEDDYMDRNL